MHGGDIKYLDIGTLRDADRAVVLLLSCRNMVPDLKYYFSEVLVARCTVPPLRVELSRYKNTRFQKKIPRFGKNHREPC